MNIYAAIFLIPFSVVVYTATGGLKVRRLSASLASGPISKGIYSGASISQTAQLRELLML